MNFLREDVFQFRIFAVRGPRGVPEDLSEDLKR